MSKKLPVLGVFDVIEAAMAAGFGVGLQFTLQVESLKSKVLRVVCIKLPPAPAVIFVRSQLDMSMEATLPYMKPPMLPALK